MTIPNNWEHWQHEEYVDNTTYEKFLHQGTPIKVEYEDIHSNEAVFVYPLNGGKRLEGIYDSSLKAIRPLLNKSESNKDLRLYMDALKNTDISIVAVDGLMGTGKTSTCIHQIIDEYIDKHSSEKQDTEILIAKPHVNSGGSSEAYGFLPGDLDDKLDPTLTNYSQYFDRYSLAGFAKLKEQGIIKILPLGFIRGIDAKNMIMIVDECQNTKELISVVTRKAKDSKIILLGDTSKYQIDLNGNTPQNNGLTHIINLLKGAPYFQHIKMKTINHVVRSAEVKDIVHRLQQEEI